MSPLVLESKRYYFITKYGKEKGISKYKNFLEKSKSKYVVKKTPVKKIKRTLTAGKTKRKFGFLFF